MDCAEVELTVSTTVLFTAARVAVTVTLVVDDTDVVVTLMDADVAPAGTVTVASTGATAGAEELSATVVATAAGPVSCTVRDNDAPPGTACGDPETAPNWLATTAT